MLIRSGAKTNLTGMPPLGISWVLTRRCNYTCSYCTVYDNKNGVFPPVDLLKRAVRKLATLPPRPLSISLSGGEPTVYPDYVEFLDFALQRLPNIQKLSTVTNLGRTPRYFNDFADKLYQWRLKLHFTASLHLEHAVIDDFFENLRVLTDRDIRVKVSVMAHPERMGTIKAVYQELLGMRQQNRRLAFGLSVIRENFRHYPDPRYTAEDLAWLSENGTKMNKRLFADEIVTVDGEERVERKLLSPAELIAQGKNKFKGMWCNAGVDGLAITQHGDVFPAVCFRSRKSQHPKMANLFADGEELKLASAPLLCPQDACGCTADLNLLKWHPDFTDNDNSVAEPRPCKEPVVVKAQ